MTVSNAPTVDWNTGMSSDVNSVSDCLHGPYVCTWEDGKLYNRNYASNVIVLWDRLILLNSCRYCNIGSDYILDWISDSNRWTWHAGSTIVCKIIDTPLKKRCWKCFNVYFSDPNVSIILLPSPLNQCWCAL